MWSEACEQAFLKAKQCLMADPVILIMILVCLYYSCDASPHGIGAVLYHVHPDQSVKPIVSVSRALSSAESHYSRIEREALAIVFAVKRLHQYVYGRHFTVTAHRQQAADENVQSAQIACQDSSIPTTTLAGHYPL